MNIMLNYILAPTS